MRVFYGFVGQIPVKFHPSLGKGLGSICGVPHFLSGQGQKPLVLANFVCFPAYGVSAFAFVNVVKEIVLAPPVIHVKPRNTVAVPVLHHVKIVVRQ